MSNLKSKSVYNRPEHLSHGANGSDTVTAAGSDPDVREEYYAIEFLESSSSVTVDMIDLNGDVRADQVKEGGAGRVIHGRFRELRVTAGSVEAYRVYPFNTFA